MPNEPIPIPETASDWMKSKDPEPRTFIVQAELPRRTVSVKRSGVRHRFSSVDHTSNGDREKLLQALLKSIEAIVPGDARTLKSAGAIVVRALPHHIQQIATLPGIREIHENRKSTRRST